MSIETLSAGQKDWVNLINNNFSELQGSDTDWQHGIVGMNGFDATNVEYRISTLKAGEKTLRFIQIDGWVTIPALKGDEQREIIKIPKVSNFSQYYSEFGSIAGTRFVLTQSGKYDDTLMIIAPYDSGSFQSYLHYLAISD